MTETGPCLVEVNSRCHGAAGSWMPLARAMTGYTQASLGRLSDCHLHTRPLDYSSNRDKAAFADADWLVMKSIKDLCSEITIPLF